MAIRLRAQPSPNPALQQTAPRSQFVSVPWFSARPRLLSLLFGSSDHYRAVADELQAQLVLDYSADGEPRVLRVPHEAGGAAEPVPGVSYFDDLILAMRR